MTKKRTDGRVQISRTVNGQHKYFYGSTKKEALRKAESFIKVASACTMYDDKLLFNEWAKHWLEIKKSQVTANTFSSYENILKFFVIPALSSSHVTPIMEHDIKEKLRSIF